LADFLTTLSHIRRYSVSRSKGLEPHLASVLIYHPSSMQRYASGRFAMIPMPHRILIG